MWQRHGQMESEAPDSNTSISSLCQGVNATHLWWQLQQNSLASLDRRGWEQVQGSHSADYPKYSKTTLIMWIFCQRNTKACWSPMPLISTWPTAVSSFRVPPVWNTLESTTACITTTPVDWILHALRRKMWLKTLLQTRYADWPNLA